MDGVRASRGAPASAASAAVQPGSRTHTVTRGETLWSISRRYGVPLEVLVRANGISDASRVRAGRKLLIPGGGGSDRSSASPIQEVAQEEFVWPVEGRVVAIFGARQGGVVNKGLDIEAPVGAEVRAARSGRVSFTHEDFPGLGKTIIIEHGGGFASVYAYVEEILVRPGESVRQRQRIARVGRTGRTEVSALHFEIRKDQKPKNPLYYLP